MFLVFRIITFSPAILASMAFTTSALFSFWCESIQFKLQDGGNSNLFSDLHFGPFYQKKIAYVSADLPGDQEYLVQEQSCADWDTNSGDENTDASLKVVRAFAVMTLIIGGLLGILLWFRPCLAGRISPRLWRIVAAVYLLLVTPLQALTFLLFHSNACRDNPVVARLESDFARTDLYESECAWDQGSTANVFSVALWLATGITMLVVGEPRRPAPSPPETQTVTYQRQTLPDGTVAVQEVAVVKGTAVPPEQKV